MIRSVYNQINLHERMGEVKYPALVYPTAGAALHTCIRDLSYSRFSVTKVSIFEDPLYAYVEVSRPSIHKTHPSLLGKLKSNKQAKDKVARLKLDVAPYSEGQKNFLVRYEIITSAASVGVDGAGLLQTA